ncbi:LOW QUALITY PROTEIN: hypothetical protein U9M48_030821 [Paspalum notatum var. saurae]|uniref:Integrase catalytic domain-containing protein n=1 Tax=Paspalum notatum var. saurae TaxID=547442 RepID=A0AAQ3U1C3_PASNO
MAIYALKKWKHYFASSSLIIRTDQQSLKYIQEQRLVEGIQHKLLIKLLGYNYTIEYKKGKENKAADALSRTPLHQSVLPITVITPTWIQEVQNSYITDERCQQLLTKLTVAPSSFPNYTLRNGLIRYKVKLFIGTAKDLKIQILSTLHASAPGRAFRIKLLVYWPGMKQDIAAFVKQCPVCQKNKSENTPYPGLLQQLPIPDMAWTHISMDFIEGLPTSNSKNVILVVVDRFTKYAHFIPLSHPYTAQLHGLPKVIVTDRHPIFTSDIWQSLFRALGVKLHLSTAYHPQTDGQTERVNQCLENYLRCMCFTSSKCWQHWLSLAEWWYNTSYHTSLNLTPFQAQYGFPPPMVSEDICTDCPNLTVQEQLRNRQVAQQVIKDNLQKAQNRIKHQADKNRQERQFAVGDMVYLKIQPYRHTSLSSHRSLKLHSKYYGPFESWNRLVELLTRSYCLKVAHYMTFFIQLKKHLGPKAVPSADLPLIDSKGTIKVAPAALLDHRLIPRNNEPVVQWLIQWLNLPPSEATWEDASCIRKVFPSFHP